MKLLVVNLKMYMDFHETLKFVKELNGLKNPKVVICPSNIYIPYFLNKGYKVGIQNIFYEDVGAYTGEVSSFLAKSMGLEYAIVGHSERRKLFNETNEIINKKIKSCLKNNLIPILCIGDNFLKNELLKQIDECLKGINRGDVIVAFEPLEVKELDLKMLDETIGFIKEQGINKVLYGGNVNINNINDIVKLCDGLLVSRSAVVPEKLKDLIKIVIDNKC